MPISGNALFSVQITHTLIYTMIKRILLLLSMALAHQMAFAQQGPLATVQKVGDRIIANTPFQFRAIVKDAPEKFDGLQFVNFGRTFGNNRAAVAYAYTHLESVSDTTVVLDISHNNSALVTVNGEKVYEKKGNDEAKIEYRERDFKLSGQFTAKLKKGSNKLLIKSETTGQHEWIVYLQPQGATKEFSEVKGLRLTTSTIPNVTPKVSALHNWLVAGPFINAAQGGQRIGMSTNFGPERGVVFGDLFATLDGPGTWTLPKVELFGDLINSHPLWGTYYTYNYHAAGVAWAMSNLAEASKQQKYDLFSVRYCDWIMDNKEFIRHQIFDLKGFSSAQQHMFNTPLLDFTAAPAVPFVYHVMNKEGKRLRNYDAYKTFVDSIIDYVENTQVRLPDGTFTRETPEKYTTWVDDMFMGIPFLVHSSRYAKDPKLSQKLMGDATNQVIGFNKNVYDPKMNLYHHAQYSKRKAFIPYWSRANGWGIWASSEVLLYLPKNHKNYKKVLKIYQNHIDGLEKHQNKNGFFHQVLNDPTSYEEVSGTAIFTLALARGLNNGWLDAKKYNKYAENGWKAVSSRINADGSVDDICVGTMSSEDVNYYKGRPTAPNDSHGLLGVLFAGMEMEKYYSKK